MMTRHDHINTADRAAFEAAVAQLGAATPVAVAFVDLDGFGRFNERAGHAAGDQLLDAYERLLAGSLPADAIVARIGGDEFAVALPGMGAESALILLDEVRAHVAANPLAEGGDDVGMSAGVASRPPHAEEPDELWRAAEEALFRAKREGGGRVAIYVEEKMVLKSNYYSRAALGRLAKLARTTGRTEASLLREALDDLFAKQRGVS